MQDIAGNPVHAVSEAGEDTDRVIQKVTGSTGSDGRNLSRELSTCTEAVLTPESEHSVVQNRQNLGACISTELSLHRSGLIREPPRALRKQLMKLLCDAYENLPSRCVLVRFHVV